VKYILLRLSILTAVLYIYFFAENNDGNSATSHGPPSMAAVQITSSNTNDGSVSGGEDFIAESVRKHNCIYKSLEDLKSFERIPVASKDHDGNGRRHMVDPPQGGKVTLVCCDTTKGPMSIAVHRNWAPLGSQRFLDMVTDNYFSSKVAMMRCMKNFLCQFGIAGEPSLNRKYSSIEDDTNWMPEGPTHMENEYGVRRFAKGYFAYAGGGKSSRSNQLIVALGDHKRLGGGSPWEVPFGEVVGLESYATLASISTQYGEKGPSQRLLRKEGSSENVAQQFPDLDYMTSCIVIDEGDM
jgi:peptidyl-prolyl cis-trans isomerase A (cyclophilin A)